MEMEKNTSHSFIHSTTAGRTALYTSYTAGIGSSLHHIHVHRVRCMYIHHKLTLRTFVLGETVDIHRMLHTSVGLLTKQQTMP